MKGLATKKFILILMGLLLTAVTSAYAEEEKFITPQSAKQFLSEHVEGKGWEEFVDAKRLVICGTKKCNIDRKVCMTKTDDKGIEIWETFRDLFTSKEAMIGAATGATLVGAGVALAKNGATRVKITKYECIAKSDQASFEKAGYKVSETGGKETKTESNAKRTKESTKEVDEKLCYTANKTEDSKVEKYCLELSGDTVMVVGVSKTKIGSNSCPAIPVSLYYQQRCTFCFLMGGIFSVADKLTVKSYSKLGKSFAILLALGLALWIAVKTLSFVSSMTKQDAAKYITEMIKQSYKFAIAYFALYYYGDVFNYIINPLLNAGLEFGNAFVEIVKEIPRAELFGDDAVSSTTRTMNDLWALGDKAPSDYLLNKENIYFRINLYAKMEHFLYNVNLVLSTLQVVGGSLVCRGVGYIRDWDHWGLAFPCVIYGTVFWLFGFSLSFAFIFYVLDAIVQLGVVGALLPFLVASWPFKITSKWTSTGFKMLLNSIFTFMMMGMVATIIYKLVDAAVVQNSNSEDGLSELVEALDTANAEKLETMVNVLSVGFCLFIFTNMIGFLLMGRVTELVNKFADGGMKQSAPGFATVMTSAAKGTAAKVTAPIRKSVSDKFDGLAKKAGKKVAGAIFGTRRKRPKGDKASDTPATVKRSTRPTASNL